MRLSLTKRGEYAVRLALHLARSGGGRITAGELGSACDIPKGNVPTVINLLSRAGVLDCAPGRGGGCRLRRPASEISVLEVVEAVEGPLGEICVLDAGDCGVAGRECALHATWAAARDSVLGSLGHLTLAEASGTIASPAARSRRRR